MASFIGFISENQTMLLTALIQHIEIVCISVFVGIVVSIPLGIIISRHKKMAEIVLGVAGIAQTIPGLVMLGLTMLVFGIGRPPALVALSIYSVFPILRNTYIGIIGVDDSVTLAAKSIGMSNLQVLLKIELPLSLPAIIGGIQLSTVYIISWATLAGMTGAGGLGDLIWTGFKTLNVNYILSGAIPSAILALTASGLIRTVQRLATPRCMKGG